MIATTVAEAIAKFGLDPEKTGSGDLINMANEIKVVVPDLGDFDAVEIIEVLVNPGDRIDVEDPIVTLESDKASMEVPSTHAGVVASVSVAVGDSVGPGTELVVLAAQSEGPEAGDDVQTESGEPAKVEEAEGAAQATPEPPSAEMDAEVEIKVPDLGDFDEVEVIEVLVEEGDRVDVNQDLITLESDKASMDVPSTHGGVVNAVKVAVGDKVSAGSVIALLGTSGDASGEAPTRIQPALEAAEPPASASDQPSTEKVAPSPPPPPSASAGKLPPVNEGSFSKAHASPSVRKFARELGADLGRIKGTGQKGRITVDDIKAFVKSVLVGGGETTGAAALPSVPEIDFARFGEVEVEKLSRIQRVSGPRLHASWVNLPHVTQFDEADVTETEATRKSLKGKAVDRGIKLTPLAFVVRAVVLALAEFPRLASSMAGDGKSLVMKRYRHIGFAADTPNGLVVPVIRDADKQDIYEIANSLGELSEKARAGKLSPSDMQGGVFTISSLGGIGGTAFTPIINAPEVAILGVSKMSTQPVYRDGAFVPRLMLPLSLSYDHRVIDGAEAVRFTTFLGQALSDVDRLAEAIP